MNQTASHRNAYYDYVRAVAILFVIAIHLFNRIPIEEHDGGGREILISAWRVLISCAVPLFLALSGFFMSRKEVRTRSEYFSFIRKQIPRVYIPCFVWSLPYFYWDINASGFSLEALFNLLFCGYSVYYFVLLIIIFYLLLPWMQRIGRSRHGLFLSIIVGVISIILWTYLKSSLLGNNPPLVYSALFFPMWMMFFVLGIYYGNSNDLRVSNLLLFVLMLSFIVLGIVETRYLSSGLGFYGATQNKLSNSLFSLCSIALCLKNASRFNDSTPSSLGHGVAYVGRISFGIYLIHMLVLMYIDLIGDKYFDGARLPWFVLMGLILVICIIIITLAKRVHDSIAVKYLGF